MRWFRFAPGSRIRVPRPARLLATIAAAVGLGVGAARAGEGLHLTWNDCWNGTGVSSRTGACTSNNGDQQLYLGFTLSQPVDQVLGTEAVVDLQAQGATLPDWWHFEPADPGLGLPAGCRYGSLAASQDFTGQTGCTDPWMNGGSALIQGYAPGSGGQARIKMVTILPSPLVVSLDENHKYYAIKLVIQNSKTVDSGNCPGCLTRVCLVLNSIWLKRSTGAAGGDVLLEGVEGLGSNWALWQGAVATDCQAVPVLRSTWGQVKSLYR